MEVTEEFLRQRYSDMGTEELIELHQTSDLTDMALAVLEEVLAERGVTTEEKKEIVKQLKIESDSLVPLASIGSRFIAQMLDGIIALLVLLIPFAILGGSSNTGVNIGIIAYIAYLLFQDGLPNGQSIGKRILGITVVNKTSGKACGLGASFIRNSILALLGIIDLLFLGSRYRQRLGDMAANTIVINVNRVASI